MTAQLAGFSQYTQGNEIEIRNNFDLTYINPDPIEDLRKRNAGSKAIAVMGLIPIDLPKILDAGDSTDNDLDNRLPEYVFPNIRIYRSERAVTTIGIVYAHTAHKYEGEVLADTTTGSASSYLEKMRKRKFAIRVANDKHFNLIRFRRFDLDPYWGVAGSLGYSPVVAESETSYVGGDFTTYRAKSNYLSMGLDGYFGCNAMFERFSLGLELIALGADFQKGAGVTKIKESSTFGNNSVDREYYTSDSWNEGTEFSSLKMSDSQVSMYKGIRFVFCLYID